MNIESDPDSLIGEVIASRYRLEARLGDGAMGTVYRARHVKVGCPFAVKVLRPSLLDDATIRRRFLREAELAGALHHPNIVGVVDMGQTSGGLCYLVMEYVPGDTLYDLILAAAPMPAARVTAIVRQLCDGLAHAHDHGLIHRDFKPENVVVERNQLGGDSLKIIDFGIAILRDEAGSSNPHRLTTAGLVLGTPQYMAPEQALGQSIDHRVDLFALGVMCFEMFTGRPPFDGDGVDIALANITHNTPAMSARAPNHSVDPLLEAFTRRLMMKSPDARPASAAAAHGLLDLIDSDRAAAAAVLGVALPVAPPRAAPSMRTLTLRAPAAPSMQTLTLRAPAAPSMRTLTLRALAAPPPPAAPSALRTAMVPPRMADRSAAASEPEAQAGGAQADVAEVVVRAPRRHAAIAIAGIGALAALMMIGALIATLRLRKRTLPDRTPLALIPARTDEATATRQPSIPEARPIDPVLAVHAPAPAVAIATRGPAPHAARRADRSVPAAPALRDLRMPSRASVQDPVALPETAQVAAPSAPPAPPTPPAPTVVQPVGDEPAPAAPSAAARIMPASPASVAELYSVVGRALKELDDSRGSAATKDLWLIYLRIRINDVFADRRKCEEADAVLRDLEQQVARRGAAPRDVEPGATNQAGQSPSGSPLPAQ